MTTFYSQVPKDPKANIDFRLKLRRAATGDKKKQAAIIEMCRQDLLFFVSAMAMIYEPRRPADLPFIPYPYQEKGLLALDSCIPWTEQGIYGAEDAGAEKSRGTGFTWMMCLIYTRRWLFQRKFAAGVVSRTADAADKLHDPDSVMWKMEYIVNWLPKWMQPDGWGSDPTLRSRFRMFNPKMGSTIFGYAATDDVSRGGRKLVYFIDEAAHPNQPGDDYAAYNNLMAVTNCRIMGSTPNGATGLFYDMMHKSDAAMKKLRFHWTQHPEWAAGMYNSFEKNGHWRVVKQDPNYDYSDYDSDDKFIKDGKTRSPWYDLQCARASSPQWIAQELDIDYLGSGSPFFNLTQITDLQRARSEGGTCELAWHRGALHWDDVRDRAVFHPTAKGKLELWFEPTGGLVPGWDDYVVACDIAAGGGGDGASNSAISVVNRRTGEKVAQYVCNEIYPFELAKLAVALCKWFHGAFLIWESNGPGGKQFTRFIVDRSDYAFYYMRRNEEDIRKKRQGMNPGYHTQKKSGLFGEYAAALNQREFINRSREALEECKQIVYGVDGEPVHSKAVSTDNPSAKKAAHGDIVVADALAWRAIAEFPKSDPTKFDPIPTQDKVPPNSILGRKLARERKERQEAYW